MLVTQILLDAAGHSPGVIDGYGGGNTSRAIAAFELANGLNSDGKIDAKTSAALRKGSEGGLLRHYALSEADVAGPYKTVPGGMAAQAKQDRLGYASAVEALAEKFHMAQGLLEALNPEVDFATAKAGTQITVAAVRNSQLPAVARIEVDKAKSEVRAYDGDGKMVASYPATVGSNDFPSPSGKMKVAAIAADANYTFDPTDQEWGGDTALTLPPGPNNPVGGVWIDLGKDGYGIHGSPDPKLIGKTASHGCVRLTNWDARKLMGAVKAGEAEVVFV
ncbi:murein L,D-transpeptidase [Sphingorhabdus soli]|uniref:Murein L,D-transpeptidase n=2 Tax=Flavisphingopyxis soli TaxID=2601267 RepID=A0A5C6U7Y9_9SPHN|nr:murein L,D-transpeptidase [Sphingorhabdus soli]